MKTIETLITVASLVCVHSLCQRSAGAPSCVRAPDCLDRPAADAILGVVLREEGVATRFGELA
jgi:hypothetical protein